MHKSQLLPLPSKADSNFANCEESCLLVLLNHFSASFFKIKSSANSKASSQPRKQFLAKPNRTATFQANKGFRSLDRNTILLDLSTLKEFGCRPLTLIQGHKVRVSVLDIFRVRPSSEKRNKHFGGKINLEDVLFLPC